MESVETPLEVLSRAATLVQHCRAYSTSDEVDSAEMPSSGSESSPLSGAGAGTGSGEPAAPKQLPSSKWRRDRRSTTRIPDYKNREAGVNGNKASRSQSFNDKSTSGGAVGAGVDAGRLRPEALHHSDGDLARPEPALHRSTVSFSSLTVKSPPVGSKPPSYSESPLDMSVRVPRTSPPSYSQAVSSSLYRPSVITQAPAPPTTPTLTKPDAGRGEYVPGSVSMCDPVIDEHFRRSLGADYMNLFTKTKESNGVTNGKTQKSTTKDRASSPIMFASDPCTLFLIPNAGSKSPKEADSSNSNPEPAEEQEEENEMEVDDNAGLSVDDHFAKALGETWKKLQENKLDIFKGNQNADGVTKSATAINNRKDLPNSNHDSKIVRGIVI